MNSQSFTDALYQYLLSININVDRDAAKIQQQLDSMDNRAKRGIWEFVGIHLNVNRTVAHNYYHNTWSAQFFDSLKSYRIVIKQMVLNNPNLSNQEIVQKVISMFPTKNFSRHSLQQVVYIQKQRLRTAPNSDNVSCIDSEVASSESGFSVDISECVRFLDAVSM
ncbi:Conserved_hypothetical protein [Hexamita inflata]|uniref:Uncharacterized protein n=1 Tax=Hexamita inflata TaxID=28002 RepID=A0AA86TV87_9EUKA|nr:Conserved hypothetical protein [Hexamita inflata]CAI9929897.1 Conserved hypothetical protein [Hexamita inflata]CAI9929906.1 Conserved hypothetical protein [Hexamita inflata]